MNVRLTEPGGIEPTAHILFVPGTRVAPLKELDPLTLGPSIVDQLVPFQCIANNAEVETVVEEPTAHTLLAETAATSTRLLLKFGIVGLETTLQAVPFQCSISVCWPRIAGINYCR